MPAREAAGAAAACSFATNDCPMGVPKAASTLNDLFIFAIVRTAWIAFFIRRLAADRCCPVLTALNVLRFSCSRTS